MMQGKPGGPTLRKLTTHQIQLAYRHLPLVAQVRGLFIQATERAGTVLSIGPAKCEMWMEGPRLSIEATTHQRPFDILLQTPQGRTGLDADPDHLRTSNGGKGAKSLDSQIELSCTQRHFIERLLYPLDAVLRDLTEKFQGHVIVFRLGPSHGKVTFS